MTRRPLHLALLLLCFLGVPHAVHALSTVSLNVNLTSAVWDPISGNFFVGVSQSDTKYPSTILIVNPSTGQIADSIPVGDNPGRLAVSADGQYLYVGIDQKAVVRRFHLPSHTPDFDITVGTVPTPGYGVPILIAVFPMQATSIIVANGKTLTAYDGSTARPATAPFVYPYYQSASLYARQSNGAFYAYTNGTISTLAVSASGVSIASSMAALPILEARATWSGGLVTDDWGYVFNLDTGLLLGRLAMPSGVVRTISVADPSGKFVLSVQPPLLESYSLTNFEPTAAISAPGFEGGSNTALLANWGTNGIALIDTGGITFAQTTSFTPVQSTPLPAPTTDSAGAIHVALPVGGIVFDPQRNVIWASVQASAGSIGNSLVSIDAVSGNVSTPVYVGSNPGPVAISGDQSRAFVGLAGSPAIVPVNLATQTAGTPYPVPTTPAQYQAAGFWYPTALANVPGEPTSVVALDSPSYLAYTYNRNVAVYDPGGPRPNTFNKPADTLINGDQPNAYYVENESTSDLSLYRLVVDSNGITLDKQLNSIGDYFFGTLAYADGVFFSDGGAEWSLDTSRVIGTFAASGNPVPLPASNQVAYVQASPGEVDIVKFDLVTFRPVSGIAVKETSVAAQNQILAAIAVGDGGIAFAIANPGISALSQQEVVIVPPSAFQFLAPLTSTLQSVAPGVQKSSLPVYAIAALPGTSNLVVSTPSTALNYGNSVLTMNPATGAVTSAIFAGSEPSLVAPTPDGRAVYTYLGGTGSLARANLTTGKLDLSFSDDFTGQHQQLGVWDMCVGADGGLAVSYVGGALAIFDSGVARKQVDLNGDNLAEFSADYQIACDQTGTRLYGYDQWVSSFDVKSWSISPNGVTPVSLTGGLTTSYFTQIRFANGLLYSSNGDLIDPLGSRDIGQYQYPNLNQPEGGDYHANAAVFPDQSTGRVYFLFSNKVLVFDMYTYALLGTMNLPPVTGNYRSLVKWNDDGLAFNTDAGELYLIQISAIPINANAVVPPPVGVLPQTSGVASMNLAANDLAYDASRNLLYASVPASEGVLANTIAAINPDQGAVTNSWPAGPNAKRLALSDDDSELYFAMGSVNNGAQYIGSGLRRIDLASGTVTPEFAIEPTQGPYIQLISDLTVLAGAPHSVAIINNFFGEGSVSVFDDTVERPVTAGTNSYLCTSIQPGPTASRLYCYEGSSSTFTFSRLAVSSSGVTVLDSAPSGLISGFNVNILFNGGRIYTTNGEIIDPESYTLLGKVAANGPVAVDGNVIYWLDTASTNPPAMLLRAFDATTFAALYTRTINTTTTAVTRLVPCGQGRLAFAAGRQIYIIYPGDNAPPTPSFTASTLVNAASGASGVAEGSLVSLYGSNIVTAVNGVVSAPALPLPTELNGVSITIAGRPVPILAVANVNGTQQINFQIPYGLAGHGSLPLIVNSGGSQSSPIAVTIAPVQPGVFLYNGQGAVFHANYTAVTPSSPAAPGETVLLYATGLGAVSPPVVEGTAAPVSPLAVSATPSVTIGGSPAWVEFSGLAPGFAGVYQVNVVIPQDAASGASSLVVALGGVSSPAVPISIP